MALDGSGGSSRNNNNEGRNGAKIRQESLKRGPWTEEEDKILKEHVRAHGEGNWNSCQTRSGLMRCGKSCRLRWVNSLRPNLKKCAFSPQEEAKIVALHATFGSKWSFIALQLPGRTDNEIKNFWNTRVKRRQRASLPIYPDNITTLQESNAASSSMASVLPLLEHAKNPTSPDFISIYDLFKTTSSRKAAAFPSNNSYFSQPSGSSNLFHQNNGLSYEQNGEAYRQMQELPSAELFAPMTTQTAFGNIGSSSYVPPTLNEAGPSSSFYDAARSHLHASIAPAWPSETNELDDDFLSLLQPPALTMSMNELFDKDGNILPDDQ